MNTENSQLLLFVGLNALVFINALWLTSLLGGWKSWTERILDALLYFVVLIVLGFECLHFARGVTIDGLCAFHGLVAVVLVLIARTRKWEIRSTFTWKSIRELGWTGQALLCLFLGWFLVYVFICRYLAPVGTDALNYHLPLPVQWLKDHQLSLFAGMFLDPQLSYTPLVGELFLAWWIVPFGNDVAVRFGQMPFLLMCLLASYTIWRRWNLPRWLALGTAGLFLVYRPFLREIVLPNNDITLAAWLMVFASQWQRLDSDWRGWVRCGLALGLLPGTKVLGLLFAVPCVALLAVRIFQLRRERTMKWVPVSVGALMLSAILVGGFSYLRNLFLTGNPLYPAQISFAGITVFPGVMNSDLMAVAHHDGKTLLGFLFSNGTFGMPTWTGWIWGMAVVAMPAGWLIRRKTNREGSEPMWFWFLLVVSYLIVIWKTPFLDERYLFPVYAIGLLFAGWWLQGLASIRNGVIAAVLVLVCAFVCFARDSVLRGMPLPEIIIFTSLLVLLRIELIITSDLQRKPLRYAQIAVILFGLFAALYFWPPYLRTYQEIKFQRYPHIYPGQGPAWVWLNDQTKGRGSIVAYAGSPLTYPLFGQDYQNTLVYVPVGKSSRRYWHEQEWPADVKMTSHETIHSLSGQVARGEPDFTSWIDRVTSARCDYLITIRDVDKDPIEARWAREHPALFRKILESPDGGLAVFEIVKQRNLEPSTSIR